MVGTVDAKLPPEVAGVGLGVLDFLEEDCVCVCMCVRERVREEVGVSEGMGAEEVIYRHEQSCTYIYTHTHI
jgi:hypothetical protein